MLDVTDKKYHSYMITERFIFIMDRILGNRANGKVTANKFGEVVGITASNLNRIRKNTTENFVTIEAVGRLCEFYKVSASWLICGLGNPFADDQLYSAYTQIEKRVTALEEEVFVKNLIKPKSK